MATPAHALKTPAPAWRAALSKQAIKRPRYRKPARLKLGAARDEAEHQADRIAARALQKGAAAKGAKGRSAGGADTRDAVRRALAPPADERLQAPPEEEQALPEALEYDIEVLTRGGEPLPPPLRRDMENRLGIDLAGVRIHADADSARLNDALHADAFTVGEDVAFNRDRYRPDHPAGRRLLAHELAHVAQNRGEAATAEQRPVRRGFWSDLYDSAADALGDIADWAADKVREYGWRLLEGISPEFARTVRAILDEGILSWLGRQVARAWDAYIATLRALVPFEGPRQLIDLFAGMVERAARITAALASGDCRPLLTAINELKTFVSETVGVAWDRLTEFLRPVGEFFSGLWNDFGAPAIRWLRDFGGDVWQGIQDLGRRLWDWIRPVRDAASRIWNWFSDLLFGPGTGADSSGSQGGVIGWISSKAGEAWDWVKQRTRPVWQPVADFAGRVAELIPPAFVRELGENAQQLSAQLDGAAEDINGGDGVPESRDTLNAVLPSVENIIAAVRRIIVGAGQWLVERIGAVASGITGLIGRLRANTLLSWLAGAFEWLSEAVASLLDWAQRKVAVLFDWMVQGFDALTPFLELILQTVRKVISIYADLLQLPLLVLNSIWQRVPACIREPIENFVKTQILSRIPVFGQFFSDPTLWPRVQQTALRILRRIFVDGDIAAAAWSFFQTVLGILGIPARLVVQILAKAARAIGDILTNPIGFLINLLRAVRAGFGRFFSNIARHLLGGVTGWLFGRLQEAGINPPTDFTLRSVLGFVLEILGLTADNIFRRLARRVGQSVVTRLRQMLNLATGVWSFVSILINEGPAGLWRELRERLSDLWNTVLQGAIGWITQVIINQTSRWLLSLLDPSGITAVVNSLVAIYRAIESFVEYLRQMLEIVNRVLDGVLDIARGAIDGAAGHLENALAGSLPVAIGFLANQLGLGRISTRIREILQRVQGLVDRALDWLIDRAIRVGRALLDLARRGVSAVRGGIQRLRDWWRARREFRVGRESHALFFQGRSTNARLMIASTETSYERFLQNKQVTPEQEADKAQAVRLARELGEAMRAATQQDRDHGNQSGRSSTTAPVDHAGIVETKLAQLATVTARFMGPDSLPEQSTDPEYGGTHASAFGTRATVTRLTRLHQRGSAPASGLADSQGYWDKLRLRYRGNSTLYVRGHLLNDNLGGPGNDWRNLTPLTQDANNRGGSSMLHAFETPVKNAVDYNKKVRFVVTANYGRGAIDTTAARAAGETVKAEIAEAERHVPLSVSCTAHELDAEGAPGDAIATPPPVQNDIGNEAPEDYQLAQGTTPVDVDALYAELNTEMTQAINANADLTWTAFRTGGRNGRIQRLQSADTDGAAKVTLLRNRIRDHHLSRLLAAERAAIAAMTQLMTWNQFKRGRSAYDRSRPQDERLNNSQIRQLEDAFTNKRDTLRTQRTTSLRAAASGLAAQENWGEFRRREGVIVSEGGLTASQVADIRQEFNTRMAALATNISQSPPQGTGDS